jgi:hypothetical protein
MLGTSNKLMVAIIIAAATTMAFAAPPPGKGGGGGGSGGGGGGGGGGGSDGKSVYAEMVQVDRDINGVPIMTWALGPKDKWLYVPSPIMFGDKDGCPLIFSELQPVAGNSIYTLLGIDARYVPFVNGEIPEDYKLCMTEARLGRLSVARAPKFVSDRGLYEFVATLSMGEVSLDEAGRLVVTYTVGDEGETESYAIDAPLQNLGGFEGILTTAKLAHADVNDGAPIVLPVHPGHTGPNAQALNLMDRAAAMLGGAADKFGYVGLDETVYLTQILGITADMTAAAKDLFGVPWAAPYGNPVTPGYFNFSKFEYDRTATYGGDVCYLKVLDPVGPPAPGAALPVNVTAEIVKEPILDVVFGNEPFTGDNVWAFARAVDDARAVIYWVHEHPLPVELYEYCDLQ